MSLNVWNGLFDQSNSDLRVELWRSAIEAVSGAVLRQRGIVPEQGYDASDDDDYVSEREGEIGDWLSESLPRSHALIDWLDGTEFFQGNGMAWFEEISLVDNACPCIDDIYESIFLRGVNGNAGRQDITKDLVEDFYVNWRASFFARVLKEARQIVD